MKIKSLILLVIFLSVFVSCEKDMKWINSDDSKADQAEILKICEEKSAECGMVEYEYSGKMRKVFCGECQQTGYECKTNNRCEDIDECADPSLNNCPAESYCENKDGTYSCICKKNYSGDDCVPDTRLKDCEGLPENAEWNTVSKITQTWNGSDWAPSLKGTYNEEPSETECRFKCKKDYHWENSQCVSNTKTDVECTGLPQNAIWNTASSITQTWSGSNWQPSNVGVYSETASTEECRFKCDANYDWNSSTSKCDAATKTYTCTGKPENSTWNSVSSYTQTWTGSAWSPADSTATYNETASAEECRFKCDTNYDWNSSTSKCDAATKTYTCTGKPENSIWNSVSSYTQTWTGSAWSPADSAASYNETASTEECRYKCDSSHTWTWENNSCINQKTVSCPSKPANTVWNDNGANGTYTQTWNSSSGWSSSYSSSYSASAGICRYKCDSTHTWEGGSCINQKTSNCLSKPANTVWNDNGANGTYTQTWSSSSGWSSSYSSSYSTSAGICKYKCDSTHTWEGGSCINQKTVTCTGLPANAQWNTASSITQTWSSVNGWQPSTTGVYSETASSNGCKYKCDSTHYWDGSECVNPCDYEPCDEVANSTKVCTASSWNQYRCGCVSGYYWWGIEKGCRNKRPNLGNICTSQNRCYNNSEEITCPTSSSADFFGQDAYYASLGKCTPQSFTVQTISNQKVVRDNNTGLMWQQTIPTSIYTWEDAVSYCDGLTYAGYSDWRLPTPQELLTIVDNGKYNPAIDTAYFPDTPSRYFWSSSTTSVYTDYAWYVNFIYGSVSYDYKTSNYDVRCVR